MAHCILLGHRPERATIHLAHQTLMKQSHADTSMHKGGVGKRVFNSFHQLHLPTLSPVSSDLVCLDGGDP